LKRFHNYQKSYEAIEMSQNVNSSNNIEYVHLAHDKYNDFESCELVFAIQPEESLNIHQRVHLLALVGGLAGFVDLKSDVARCPKHVLSDLVPETLLASPCARLFPTGDTHGRF
jgi:hypothetical protein